MILWLLLLASGAPTRPYHQETIASMATSRHTHVQVAGRVTLVRREADGDVHIRLSDAAGRFIIAEIIPTLQPMCQTNDGVHPIATTARWCPLLIPVVGQAIVVFGIRRFDNEVGHLWYEVHPVERWVPAAQ